MGDVGNKGSDIFQEGGCNFYIKDQVKSEIFNWQKKFIYKQKSFSVITKNSNWEIFLVRI